MLIKVFKWISFLLKLLFQKKECTPSSEGIVIKNPLQFGTKNGNSHFFHCLWYKMGFHIFIYNLLNSPFQNSSLGISSLLSKNIYLTSLAGLPVTSEAQCVFANICSYKCTFNFNIINKHFFIVHFRTRWIGHSKRSFDSHLHPVNMLKVKPITADMDTVLISWNWR